MLRTLDLFSGIGGFSLGLQRTQGFETIAFCEIDGFCRKVLAKHWPAVPCFEDIKKLNKEELDGLGQIDVICGGFPCQPVSCAGKRKGKEDARWLWPEFYRIVCEVKPEWVLVENVPGLLSADSGRLFAGILRDLAPSGYDAEWNIVSAASIGAPHLRRRIFVVAHSKQQSDRCQIFSSEIDRQNSERSASGIGGSSDGGRKTDASNSGKQGLEIGKGTPGERAHATTAGDNWWAVEPDVGRVANGIPGRVDRLRALGNAIVPQCAQYVGQCVLETIS